MATDEEKKESNVQHFLDLIKKSRRGKFKIYMGMSAGVGKTYRMLQEAHTLLKSGINIQIGYIEPHNRPETIALVTGLPAVSRKQVFYKGKALEEMDLAAILAQHPEVVIVDELAHTNIPGSRHEKRWQDVQELLENGISVISAVNIQHLESLNGDIEQITGIAVSERIPDTVLAMADEVVNIDLTAEELLDRLKAGKIYEPAKIQSALRNFFTADKLLQLRELALKEVARYVERKIDTEISPATKVKTGKFLACISSNEKTARLVIRKTARLASFYQSHWMVLYVQTPAESPERIGLAAQRHLINNLKLATELGAEVIRIKNPHIGKAIIETAEQRQATIICIGKPHLSLWQVIWRTSVFNLLLKKLSKSATDLIILS